MISPKKIHECFVKALEEPFVRAEMHRVEMLLPEKKEPELQVIKGGKSRQAGKGIVRVGQTGC
ncbi:MAG: hypothetical protein K6T80_08200 [Firmicutes bacterium]|nr:hypothetical protein [Bacillota bacterium]